MIQVHEIKAFLFFLLRWHVVCFSLGVVNTTKGMAMTSVTMNNRPFNRFAGASFDFPAASGRGSSRVHQGISRLAQIEAKHPNLDQELVGAREMLESIKDSDTLGGLKWYEWLALPVLPLILSGNKQMIRDQRSEVAELERLVHERDGLRETYARPMDTFEAGS